MAPILVTGAILGQHKLTKPQAASAAKLFGLSKSEQTLINAVPMRGTATPMPLMSLTVQPAAESACGPPAPGARSGRKRVFCGPHPT